MTTKKLKYESEWMRSREATEQPIVLPGIGSAIFHILAIIVIATQIQSCQSHGIQSQEESNVHEVGLYVKKPAPPTQKPDANDPNPTPMETTPAESQPLVDDTPPVSAAVPHDLAHSLIAPGTMSQTPNTNIERITTLPGTKRPRHASAVPPGTVEFFNIKATGRSFVFLIDKSDSMGNFGSFRVAKQQVLANINNLQPDQRFQVIFYNDRLTEMTDHNNKKGLALANKLNLTLARNFISEQHESGGTAHYPAIMQGLSYKADVIFFLTDADQPGLNARELEAVRKLNRGRAEIHCIEFADSPDLKIENFLRVLARQTKGTYRHRNVRQFGKR